MTKLHFSITARENYAQWACLCIDSLIRRGRVAPSDIIVSLHEMLQGGRAAELLRSIGVEIRLYSHGETYWNKFVLLDQLFREHPEVTEVIQLDCDVVLTEDMDFVSRLHSFSPDSHLVSYLAPGCPPQKTFRGRSGLFIPGFSLTSPVGSRGRLDAFLRASFNFSLESFESSLEELPWVYGGVLVVRRPITLLPVWRAMLAFSWLCSCDESTIVLGLHYSYLNPSSGFQWAPIPQSCLAHRLNPPILNLTDGPGLVHYAGDWYRIKNERIHEQLEEAFDSLESSITANQ
jgi:hypothetical protein